MKGTDVQKWRKRTGYSQKELQVELGFKSRTSISSLENEPEKIPRLVELALAGLEIAPFLRQLHGRVMHDTRAIAYPAISEQKARDIYNEWTTGKFVTELSTKGIH